MTIAAGFAGFSVAGFSAIFSIFPLFSGALVGALAVLEVFFPAGVAVGIVFDPFNRLTHRQSADGHAMKEI
jgi:hypothetical protein